MNTTPTTAHRRSLFAVWHWPRWTWFVIVPMMLLAYTLSIGPMTWLSRLGYLPSWTDGPIYVMYRPLTLAAAQSESAGKMLTNYVAWWNESAERQVDEMAPDFHLAP